jgi:hypothetical protein
MANLIQIIPYAIGTSMFAVLVVLIAGVVLMSRGGTANERFGNLMMRLRVATQGVTVLLMLTYFLLTRSG